MSAEFVQGSALSLIMRRFFVAALMLTACCLQAQTRFVKIVNNVADMVALNPNDVHSEVAVKYALNQGAQDTGGIFYYEPFNNTATNTTTIFKPTNFGGRWLRSNAPSSVAGAAGIPAGVSSEFQYRVDPVTFGGSTNWLYNLSYGWPELAVEKGIRMLSLGEPFITLITNSINNGITNYTKVEGYNIYGTLSNGDKRANTNGHGYSLETEMRYAPDGTVRQVEWNNNFRSHNGIYRRGFVYTLDTNTFLQAWQWRANSYQWVDDTAAAVYMAADSAGVIVGGANPSRRFEVVAPTDAIMRLSRTQAVNYIDFIMETNGVFSMNPSGSRVRAQGSTFRAEGSTGFQSYRGTEIGYDTSLSAGTITAYDRDIDEYRNLYVSGSNLFLNATIAGLVGVGTTNPTVKLDVHGSANVTNLIRAYNGVFTNSLSVGSTNLTVADDPYDATTWNGNLTVPTKNAIRDQLVSGGIGTPAGATLDLQFNNGGVFGGQTNWGVGTGSGVFAQWVRGYGAGYFFENPGFAAPYWHIASFSNSFGHHLLFQSGNAAANVPFMDLIKTSTNNNLTQFTMHAPANVGTTTRYPITMEGSSHGSSNIFMVRDGVTNLFAVNGMGVVNLPTTISTSRPLVSDSANNLVGTNALGLTSLTVGDLIATNDVSANTMTLPGGDVQLQLNGKAALTHQHVLGEILSGESVASYTNGNFHFSMSEKLMSDYSSASVIVLDLATNKPVTQIDLTNDTTVSFINVPTFTNRIERWSLIVSNTAASSNTFTVSWPSNGRWWDGFGPHMPFTNVLEMKLLWTGRELLGTWTAPGIQMNDRAITDPTATDDVSKSYSYGSPWVNRSGGTYWICLNPAAGAAVWTNLTGIATANSVTAASTFGTDNVILRSDGTGRGAQSTAIVIDDSNNISGIATLSTANLDLTNKFSPTMIRTNDATVGGRIGFNGTNTDWIAEAHQTVYAAGTVYSLTATPAKLDFGTTDPALTITLAGTYRISGAVGVKYNGTTYGTAQTATLKFRRTNNTAADLANGGRTVEMPVLTTFTGGDVLSLPTIFYAATAGDTIEIFGSVSATPSVGTVDTDSAEIIIERLY